MDDLCNYIGGRFVTHSDDQWLDNTEPATGSHICRVPLSDSSDVDAAVAAARSAHLAWSALSHSKRADWLDRIADALETRYEDVAALESRDTGKPISLARDVDAQRSVSNFRFFAE
ncbi:MAG: aldehyde dehydrogenase, partial [Planctomycetes bacterium]|nr:aldehyde dehydrogenase [Planctomycetota bacterium]